MSKVYTVVAVGNEIRWCHYQHTQLASQPTHNIDCPCPNSKTEEATLIKKAEETNFFM